MPNYKLAWCNQCQDWHRPPQPQNHKGFHTDPFGTRYIPFLPTQTCTHCGGSIEYDRNYGGWLHSPGLFGRYAFRQCLITPAQWADAQPVT